MLRNIPLGVFYPGSSIIHRLQARTKLLMILWLLIVLVIANKRQWHFAPYIVALAIIGCGIAFSGIALREIWKRSWFLVILMFASAFFSIFASTQNSRVLLKVGPFYPMYGSLLSTGLIVGGASLLFLLTGLLPGGRWIWQFRILKVLRILLILVVLAVLVFLLLTVGTVASKSLTIGPFLITERSSWVLMTSFVVFIVLYLSALLLTMTTMPVALIEGMTLLLSPLRRFKLPVDDFALMTLLALRFIPTLLDETEQLVKAQTARGADVMHGTLRERFQSLAMFFLPLIQGSFRRASEMSTALEARGYQSDGQRTLLHETTLHWRDYLAISLVLIATISTLFL